MFLRSLPINVVDFVFHESPKLEVSSVVRTKMISQSRTPAELLYYGISWGHGISVTPNGIV